MIRLFSLTGAACVLIFATSIYVYLHTAALNPSEVPDEVKEQLGLYGCLDFGVIPTDPAQWDGETQKEFFGNLPTEHRQRYIETFAKLHKANTEYWKIRAELFNVIHPLFERGELEQTLKQEKEILASRKKDYDNALRVDHPESSNQRVWAWKQYEKILAKCNAFEAMLKGNYSIYAEQQAHRREVEFLWDNHHDFYQYPDVLDPNKEAEFWNTLAEETLYNYDKVIEGFQRNTAEHKKQMVEFKKRLGTMNWILAQSPMTKEDLPDDMRGMLYLHVGGYSNIVSQLTDEQKLRLINDEPLFIKTGVRYNSYLPQFAMYNILKEARDAEREQWKVDATPELSELGIDQAEVARWDGSLSLHPFIRTIAERCEDIDLTPLQTTIHHGSMWGFGEFSMAKAAALSNTQPALLALVRNEKDVVFSARRFSPADIETIARQREGKTEALLITASGETRFKDGDASPETIKLVAAELDDKLVYVPFAKDAFVFLQNRRNPVRNMTVEQYQGVFSGQHKSWKDVGGFGGEIRPFVRNTGSGSKELMQTLVMRDILVHENFKPKKLNLMSAVFELLESSPGGIAYSIYHYDRYMVFNAHTRVMAVDGVFPNAETIASGEYPLVYECVLVHRKEPGEKVERFVRWLLSDEGQKLVRSVGYVPVRELTN